MHDTVASNSRSHGNCSTGLVAILIDRHANGQRVIERPHRAYRAATDC